MALPEIALANDDGTVVCERCLLAETPLARMRGLLGRSGLPAGEGLLLRPAASIHMAFMRFPIDAVFLDSTDRVVKVVAELKPWGWQAAGAPGRCWSSRPARLRAAGSFPGCR